MWKLAYKTVKSEDQGQDFSEMQAGSKLLEIVRNMLVWHRNSSTTSGSGSDSQSHDTWKKLRKFSGEIWCVGANLWRVPADLFLMIEGSFYTRLSCYTSIICKWVESASILYRIGRKKGQQSLSDSTLRLEIPTPTKHLSLSHFLFSMEVNTSFIVDFNKVGTVVHYYCYGRIVSRKIRVCISFDCISVKAELGLEILGDMSKHCFVFFYWSWW